MKKFTIRATPEQAGRAIDKLTSERQRAGKTKLFHREKPSSHSIVVPVPITRQHTYRPPPDRLKGVLELEYTVQTPGIVSKDDAVRVTIGDWDGTQSLLTLEGSPTAFAKAYEPWVALLTMFEANGWIDASARAQASQVEARRSTAQTDGMTINVFVDVKENSGTVKGAVINIVSQHRVISQAQARRIIEHLRCLSPASFDIYALAGDLETVRLKQQLVDILTQARWAPNCIDERAEPDSIPDGLSIEWPSPWDVYGDLYNWLENIGLKPNGALNRSVGRLTISIGRAL